MPKISFFLFSLLVLTFLFTFQSAQADVPRVGRRAAARYFAKDMDTDREVKVASPGSTSNQNVLMLHVGGYTNSSSYQWHGADKRLNVGKATYGVTYLFGTWANIDVNIRFDFNEFKLDDERVTKLSFLPLWTFPMADSKFPLYFGGGAGLGVFFTQITDESNLSLDYQLVAGARFTELYENLGVFVEFGLKNHLHLLSDGQFNGTALSTGAVFTF
jgi:hypothetical protein